MNLFKRKSYITIPTAMPEPAPVEKAEAPMIPDGMWVKCAFCKKIVYQKDIGAFKICPHCGGHFRLGARERLQMICDPDTFEEWDADMIPENPINYPDYDKIIKKAQKESGLKEAVVTGYCRIEGQRTAIAVMDSHFMMGSMGSVVGEKVTRTIERATAKKWPIVIFTTSGGARMQEGIISLMQMAKVSSALSRHNEAGLLYITVLTDPTTGGVTASFAMLGDIILSEPGALIGFAGQRVIESTLNEKLPEGFQRAEFQLEHGFVDKIVPRTELKETLGLLLKLHRSRGTKKHE